MSSSYDLFLFLGHKPPRWWIFPFYVAKRPDPLRSVCVDYTLRSPSHFTTEPPMENRGITVLRATHPLYLYSRVLLKSTQPQKINWLDFEVKLVKMYLVPWKACRINTVERRGFKHHYYCSHPAGWTLHSYRRYPPLALHFWRVAGDWQHSLGSPSIWYPFWQSAAACRALEHHRVSAAEFKWELQSLCSCKGRG